MKRKQMGHGALCIILALALASSTTLWSGDALAIPTFQTYIEGATAGSSGQDLNTWFITANSFDLSVVSSYGAVEDNIVNTTLLVSVPQGQTGTISIGGLTPLTSSPETKISPNISILSNVSGYNGYSTLSSFLPVNPPPDGPLPLHYPLVDPEGINPNVSAFLIYDLGTFAKNSGLLYDYDASTSTEQNPPQAVSALGEEKTFSVSFTGFSSLHFDVYGLYIDDSRESSLWVINPDSHDATALASAAAVPEPSTLLLLGSGLISLGLFGRRSLKVSKA